VQELDWVLNGDDVLGPRGVDAVNHGGQRGGLAGTGYAGHQRQPALLVADLFHDARHVQLVQRTDLGRDDAQHQSHVAALLEHVHAEAPQPGDAVCHVQLGLLLEFLLLAIRHHAERHVQHLFRRDARLVGERDQFAVHAHVRVIADFQVKVGRLAVNCDSQQIVNMHEQARDVRSGHPRPRSLALWPESSTQPIREQ
jgi:hypothetical protein